LTSSNDSHQWNVNFIRAAHDWEVDFFTLFFNLLYFFKLRRGWRQALLGPFEERVVLCQVVL
jgi:hypothetical protein